MSRAPTSSPVMHAMCVAGYDTACGLRITYVNAKGDGCTHMWERVTCPRCIAVMVGALRAKVDL